LARHVCRGRPSRAGSRGPGLRRDDFRAGARVGRQRGAGIPGPEILFARRGGAISGPERFGLRFDEPPFRAGFRGRRAPGWGMPWREDVVWRAPGWGFRGRRSVRKRLRNLRPRRDFLGAYPRGGDCVDGGVCRSESELSGRGVPGVGCERRRDPAAESGCSKIEWYPVRSRYGTPGGRGGGRPAREWGSGRRCSASDNLHVTS
jgi:hypothetical protein